MPISISHFTFLQGGVQGTGSISDLVQCRQNMWIHKAQRVTEYFLPGTNIYSTRNLICTWRWPLPCYKDKRSRWQIIAAAANWRNLLSSNFMKGHNETRDYILWFFLHPVPTFFLSLNVFLSIISATTGWSVLLDFSNGSNCDSETSHFVGLVTLKIKYPPSYSRLFSH